MKEQNRETRGHVFLPWEAVVAVPGLNEQDGKGYRAIAYLHYYIGDADWYVTELDPKTGEAFGWAEILPGCGELGYFNLHELEAVLVNECLPVERDYYWEPRSIREALADRAGERGELT